jgi:hypothetical protein
VTPAALVLTGVAVGALLASRPALADPNDYVLDLDFVRGEHEFDAKAGAASATSTGKPATEAAALAWGTGVSDSWLTEIYGQFANAAPASRGGGLDALSWENIVRFAEPGEWPVDLGGVFEVERARVASQGWQVTLGPMAQVDLDRLQINLNVLFRRAFASVPGEPTQIGYQFQVKYRAMPQLEYGMQGLGDIGTWNRWSNPAGQDHRMGPALFGRIRLGHGRIFKYNGAVLFGTSRGAADRTVRAQVDYEYW